MAWATSSNCTGRLHKVTAQHNTAASGARGRGVSNGGEWGCWGWVGSGVGLGWVELVVSMQGKERVRKSEQTEVGLGRSNTGAVLPRLDRVTAT